MLKATARAYRILMEQDLTFDERAIENWINNIVWNKRRD